MKNEKAIFDLDGVLLDSEADLGWLEEALRDALEELGLPVTEEYLEMIFPIDVGDFERAVKDLSGAPEELWKIRDRHYVEKKLEMLENGELKPFPDVDRLYDLKDEFQLGIISNSPTEIVEKFVRVNELEDLFEIRVGRETELDFLRKVKPSPHMFEKLRAKMGKGKYWYVGDKETDGQFAHYAGMKFIHLTRDDGGFDSLEAVTEYLLEQL